MHGTEWVVTLPEGALEQHDLSWGGLNNSAICHSVRVKVETLDVLAIQPFCSSPLVGADEADTDTVEVPTRTHGVPHSCKS
jgi:hypothetical protein